MATARDLVRMPLSELQPAPRNPKGHDDEGIGASLDEFGYVEPIVMDERTGRLVVGHGRWENLLAKVAAGEDPPEGIEVEGAEWMIPVMRGWSSRDDAHAEAYLVASNHLTTKGGWIVEPLAEMLTDLAEHDLLDVTGFRSSDLEEMLEALRDDEPEPEPDPEPDVDEVPADPVTQRGDVWVMGPHRVMCGDCRDADDVVQLLAGAVVNLAVTSPPYADRRDYDESSGFAPIPPDEYVEWFAPVAARVAEHLAVDGSWLVNIKAGSNDLDRELYVMDLVAAHVREWGWHFAEEFCWERSGIPKRPTMRLKNQFEPVFQFVRGRWKWRPDAVMHPTDDMIVPLGPGAGDTNWARGQGMGGGAVDRNMKAKPRKPGVGAAGAAADHQGTNWAPGEATAPGMAYPGNRLPSFSGTHEATGHAAAFPVGLPEWFATLMTDVGDVVFDPFVGSGSTILAAHHVDRAGYGMDLSRGYVDITLRRVQRHTGIVPVLESTGEPHDFLVDELDGAQ